MKNKNFGKISAVLLTFFATTLVGCGGGKSDSAQEYYDSLIGINQGVVDESESAQTQMQNVMQKVQAGEANAGDYDLLIKSLGDINSFLKNASEKVSDLDPVGEGAEDLRDAFVGNIEVNNKVIDSIVVMIEYIRDNQDRFTSSDEEEKKAVQEEVQQISQDIANVSVAVSESDQKLQRISQTFIQENDIVIQNSDEESEEVEAMMMEK